jgi:integrase
MERTRHPGIYRRGSRYVVTYRAAGKQRKESAGTLTEARKMRAARQADVARGEFHEATRLTFEKYATEWIERYQGRGRGFRESTRDDYRRLLACYAFPYFDERLRRRTLSQITPRDVANFVGWLCDERAQAKHHKELAEREAEAARHRGERPPRRRSWPETRRLSDSTVRNALNPVRACLATAVGEGLIRHNPTLRVPLPHRPVVAAGLEEDEARAFTREQLDTVLRVVHPRHQLFLRFMAATGVRISEAIALQWQHLALDGSSPHVKVRRGIVRGRVQPPKSRHGRRDIPLDHVLVSELRRRRALTEWPDDEDPIFPSLTGTVLIPRNARRRVLAPAAEEAGAPWAGFHTFRHTCASLLFERGANAKQVQRWLGHHSAAFTLATYVHLLTDALDEPLDLALELESAGQEPAVARSSPTLLAPHP